MESSACHPRAHPQIPKQLFITPVGPPVPAYFFGQYLNIKQAVQTVLSEIWRAENPPTPTPRGSTPTPDGSEGSPSKMPMERQRHLPNPAGVITTHRTMTKAFREGNWKGPNYYFNIAGQVSALDLGKFQGRQHSGLDVGCR
jgi:3'-5' exoribonuclease 1